MDVTLASVRFRDSLPQYQKYIHYLARVKSQYKCIEEDDLCQVGLEAMWRVCLKYQDSEVESWDALIKCSIRNALDNYAKVMRRRSPHWMRPMAEHEDEPPSLDEIPARLPTTDELIAAYGFIAAMEALSTKHEKAILNYLLEESGEDSARTVGEYVGLDMLVVRGHLRDLRSKAESIRVQHFWSHRPSAVV